MTSLIGFRGSNSSTSTPRQNRDADRSGTGGSAHPYANAESSGLNVPNTGAAHGLSPVAEGFNGGSSSSANRNGGYAVGKGPFKSPANNPYMSLEDLRKRIVKFTLGESQTSKTIAISDGDGGVDILEAALKKFGKGGGFGLGANGVSNDEQLGVGEVEGGGLTVDGWGVFLEGPSGESSGE